MRDLLYLKDDQIKEFIQLLYYAYRETFSDPREILSKKFFGPAHLRALHLIERNPGINLGELIFKLKVTKQSLNRVLRDLIRSKMIKQIQDENDTRKKNLFLDKEGKIFFESVYNTQKKRIFNALKNSSSDSVIKFKDVLKKLLMENSKLHILVVDDDDRIRNLLKDYLSENHYIVSTAENAEQAKIKLEYLKFDILILDVMMPGENGYELTRYVKNKMKVPIILLTAKGEVENRIKGLELGVEDYIGKPFEPKELLLRIKNIIKKENKIDLSSLYKVGEAQVNLNKMIIVLKSKNNKINNSEKRVLVEMLSNPGKTFSRDEIGKISGIKQERSIDVMITRLRQKLETDPKNPKYLQTIRGEGYVLWVE